MGRARRNWAVCVAGAAIGASLAIAPQIAQSAALELVLAVDVSTSISRREYALQMAGIADAFRDPVVQRAIDGAADAGGVYVALMQWSGPETQTLAIDWTHLDGRLAAERLAARVEAAPRPTGRGGTAIGSALHSAADLIRGNGIVAARSVIDVTGDGRNNGGHSLPVARAAMRAAGITVNALAILDDVPGLDGYYRDRLIVGPGAFVMQANRFPHFAAAFRRKLLREIGNPPLSMRRDRLRGDQERGGTLTEAKASGAGGRIGTALDLSPR